MKSKLHAAAIARALRARSSVTISNNNLVEGVGHVPRSKPLTSFRLKSRTNIAPAFWPSFAAGTRASRCQNWYSGKFVVVEGMRNGFEKDIERITKCPII